MKMKTPKMFISFSVMGHLAFVNAPLIGQWFVFIFCIRCVWWFAVSLALVTWVWTFSCKAGISSSYSVKGFNRS